MQFNSTNWCHIVHVGCDPLSTSTTAKICVWVWCVRTWLHFGGCPSAHTRQASCVRETQLSNCHPWGLAEIVYLRPSQTLLALCHWYLTNTTYNRASIGRRPVEILRYNWPRSRHFNRIIISGVLRKKLQISNFALCVIQQLKLRGR